MEFILGARQNAMTFSIYLINIGISFSYDCVTWNSILLMEIREWIESIQ